MAHRVTVSSQIDIDLVNFLEESVWKLTETLQSFLSMQINEQDKRFLFWRQTIFNVETNMQLCLENY